MNLAQILKEKTKKSLELKEKYNFSKKNKALWLIKIENKALLKELRDGLLELNISFIVEINWAENEKLWENIIAVSKLNETDIIWFDFIICDNEIKHLNNYLEKWITPIITHKNPLKNLLSDFNPVKNEWNAFLFEKENKWCIYSALVRYMENYKFPFDNKNLIKNVLKI